jgi:tRNA pseudouridine55 synthase
MNGLLVIDKPTGMTSRDVVNRVQKWFPRKTKIGHTGTLDPLATGVLVVCIGAATRLADYIQAMSKSYTSRFHLGVTSTTDDADGDVTAYSPASIPTREQVDLALTSFVGTIEQVPPAFSALKVSGQRAYNLARQGNEVQLAGRQVRIDAIRVSTYGWPILDVEIDCGKGTYIRSIARDVGAKLGCGGMVETLRRTRIGPFTAEQGIGTAVEPAEVKLLPLTDALNGMRRFQIDAEAERRFRMGQPVPTPERNDLPHSSEKEFAVLSEAGELIGIGELRREQIQPTLVINI